MSDQPDPAGLAALSICEALLLALQDRKLLPDSEIIGILSDAAETLGNADCPKPERKSHAKAADLIHEIIEGGTLAHRP